MSLVTEKAPGPLTANEERLYNVAEQAAVKINGAVAKRIGAPLNRMLRVLANKAKDTAGGRGLIQLQISDVNPLSINRMSHVWHEFGPKTTGEAGDLISLMNSHITAYLTAISTAVGEVYVARLEPVDVEALKRETAAIERESELSTERLANKIEAGRGLMDETKTHSDLVGIAKLLAADIGQMSDTMADRLIELALPWRQR